MAEEKHTILVVDDAADARSLLEMMLEDRFTVISVDSGKACFESISQITPDLILLDVHMPNMNGYDVCQKLKADSKTQAIPVIFVSGAESDEERLHAYDEGAADYLIKPYNGDELLEKIDNALIAHKKIQGLEKSSAAAMSTAMEAMTTSSEMGVLMNFVRASMNIKDSQKLVKELFGSLEQFGLSACFLLHQYNGANLHGCEKNSMEGKVLLSLKNEQPVYEFGSRIIILRENIRLLIKNMPVNEEVKYGRLKDNLNIFCDCANASVGNLNFIQKVSLERDRLMEQIIEKSEAQLSSVRKKLTHQESETQRTMSKLVNDLDDRLFSLGLDDDQEKALRSLADQTHEDIHSLSAINKEIFISVDNVMQGLYHLVQNEV